MNDFKFNRLAKDVPGSFNITDARAKELVTEFHKAGEKIRANPLLSSRDITIEFLDIAKTPDEKAYALFSAGVYTQQMHEIQKNAVSELEEMLGMLDQVFGRRQRPAGSSFSR